MFFTKLVLGGIGSRVEVLEKELVEEMNEEVISNYFEIGDVVVLKSGGRMLTVIDFVEAGEETVLGVAYSDEYNTLEFAVLPAAAVDLVEDEDEDEDEDEK